MPVDSSAEILLELLEECEDGSRKDLFYPEFQTTSTDPSDVTGDDTPVKKVSQQTPYALFTFCNAVNVFRRSVIPINLSCL